MLNLCKRIIDSLQLHLHYIIEFTLLSTFSSLGLKCVFIHFTLITSKNGCKGKSSNCYWWSNWSWKSILRRATKKWSKSKIFIKLRDSNEFYHLFCFIIIYTNCRFLFVIWIQMLVKMHVMY